MSVAACEQKCDELQGCTGIVVQPASGGFSCYRKADIDLARCDSGTNFDTYLKPNHGPAPGPTPKGWTKAPGKNCWGSRNGQPAHGAKDLEHPPSASCGVMSVAACEQKCDELQGCTGIVVQPASGGFSCYRKADIDLARCDSGTYFDTYLKPNGGVTDLARWLARLGLGFLARAFREQGYDRLDDIMEMGVEELRRIRDMDKDHASRIFQEAAKLRHR